MIDLKNTTLSVESFSGTMMISLQMVCICFVFSFDAIFEIITTICSFVVNLKVRSPGASELHLYFDACSENDVNLVNHHFCLRYQNIQI